MITIRCIALFILLSILNNINTSAQNPLHFEVDGQQFTPAERMAQVNVNGISVAIVKDFKIDTLFQWGQADPATQRAVTANTIFQVGGMTAVITQLATLRAAELGIIDLDTDINQYLTSWKLPQNKFTKDNPVTCRQLLSKRRGFEQASKPTGYAPGEAIPTLLQVLNGEKPAKNKPITVRSGTMEMDNYSFETEVILQQLLEDIYHKPFDVIIATQFFTPLAMTNSSFNQELTPEQAAMAAIGFTTTGDRIKGDRWAQPELGSAGLWTTAEDYAKLMIELSFAYHKKSTTLINAATAELAFTRAHDSKSLAMNVSRDGNTAYYGGASMGFRTSFDLNFREGSGIVVLMNSHENWRFMNEVMNTLKSFYQL